MPSAFMEQAARARPRAKNLSTWIQQCGYWMVCFGALAESESVLLVAVFRAHRGLLRLPWAMGLAFVAGTLGDQFCFHLRRRNGQRVMARYRGLARLQRRVQPLLTRYPNASILSLRFLYGLRTAGPIAMAALGVSCWSFALLLAVVVVKCAQ